MTYACKQWLNLCARFGLVHEQFSPLTGGVHIAHSQSVGLQSPEVSQQFSTKQLSI